MRSPNDSPTSSSGDNALIRKLERFSALACGDRLALDDLARTCEWVPPDRSIVTEGDASGAVLPLLEGLAYRHKDFRDGRRQIISLLVPGDMCGGHGRLSRPTNYGVRTLTRCKIARISRQGFVHLLDSHPAIAEALNEAALVEEAVLRTWIVNLGQRHAHERMAHLLCEWAQRMADCGRLLAHGGFELPLTQQGLGAALGLTSVHVNRVLQRLRAENLVAFQNGTVRIFDFDRLRAVADFDPAYLSARVLREASPALPMD
ncbi:MAG: Crp/Fnr family transcriptional regulator [Caulobacteraceae bacterium]|nr:Crp/Fnr family transcriptional regulator [Caulobacteraceae bacterium]